MRVKSSFCSLGSIGCLLENTTRANLGIECRGGENLSVGKPRARHPLLVIIVGERVDRAAVRADAVFPRVAPARELLLRPLAQINDGKAAAVAQDIVVGDFFRL